MTPLETAAVLALLIATITVLAVAIFLPIRWAIRRRAHRLEYEQLLREHGVFNRGGRDRVI